MGANENQDLERYLWEGGRDGKQCFIRARNVELSVGLVRCERWQLSVCMQIGRSSKPRRIWLLTTRATNISAFVYDKVLPDVSMRYLEISESYILGRGLDVETLIEHLHYAENLSI